MRTLTFIAIVGVFIPSLLSLFRKNDRLPLIDRVVNSLARMVKLSLIVGFGFGAVGLGAAVVYYVAPLLNFTVQADTIELSSVALKYYAVIGVLFPVLGILVGSMLTNKQSA